MRWEFLKITKFTRLTMLLFVLLLASNCANFGSTNNIGYIVVSAKFPQSNFKIKNIPAKTTKIVLTISGEGLNTPINFILTPTTSSLIIPAIKGNKTLSATAYDDSGNILAFGKNTLYVKANIHNTVEIILVEGATPNNTDGTASSSPSGNVSPSATTTPNGATIPNNTNPSNPNTDASASPTPSDSPVATATPSPSPASNSNYSSTYYPAINVNVNLVASTPIPSGISLGMVGRP